VVIGRCLHLAEWVAYVAGSVGLSESVFGEMRSSTGCLAFHFEQPFMELRPGSILFWVVRPEAEGTLVVWGGQRQSMPYQGFAPA